MNKFVLLGLLLVAVPAFAGERQVINPDLDGNLVLRVNSGGTIREALKLTGADTSYVLGDSTAAPQNNYLYGRRNRVVSATAGQNAQVMLYAIGDAPGDNASTYFTGTINAVDDTGAAPTVVFGSNKASDIADTGATALTTRDPFTFQTGATTLAKVSAAGGWTLGVSGGTQNQTVNGKLVAQTSSLLAHQFIYLGSGSNTDTAGLRLDVTAGNWAILDVASAAGTNNAILRLSPGASGTSRFVNNGGTGFGFYNTNTLIANSDTNGSWNFGPVSNAANHFMRGSLAAQATTTTNAGNIFELYNGSTVLEFAVRGAGQIAVNSGGWGTGGTAVGVSAGVLTTSPSSLRYKENIVPLAGEIDTSKIFNLVPVVFDYKAAKGGAHSFGLIAEAVYEEVPALVNREADPEHPGTLRPESVAYDHLSVLLLVELKKLKMEFDAYKTAHP